MSGDPRPSGARARAEQRAGAARPASEAAAHTVTAPPGHAALGWGVLGVAALPLVLLPLLEPSARTPSTAIASLAALAVLVVLLQAGFLRARLRVEVDRGAAVVRLRGPLYAREVPLADLARVEVRDDGGQQHGWLNWPVSGRAASRGGVRLTLGGSAAVVLRTRDGRRWTVVTEDRAQAERIAADLQAAGLT